MLPYILHILSIAFAAICSAVMSSVDNEPHYLGSIFSKYSPKFWSKAGAWQAWKIPGTKYTFNAWHIFQSGMYTCFLAAGYAFRYCSGNILLFLAIDTTILILTFNLCYNHLFKLK